MGEKFSKPAGVKEKGPRDGSSPPSVPGPCSWPITSIWEHHKVTIMLCPEGSLVSFFLSFSFETIEDLVVLLQPVLVHFSHSRQNGSHLQMYSLLTLIKQWCIEPKSLTFAYFAAFSLISNDF